MKKYILGTDWWTDCDDAVAVRILTQYINENKIKLLGIGINACMEYSVASLNNFLTYDGIYDVPIGIDRSATDYAGTPQYQKNLALNSDSKITNETAPDAVKLYRKIISEATEPIEIIEIGFLQVFSNLLKSEGDEYSDKNGVELVREKVSKVWVMAGKWDEDGGKEHNFCITPRAREAGAYFCENCPVPVTFLGWEIGADVITGDTLRESDLLHQVLSDHGSANGRMSWDPMLTLLAIMGDESAAGYDTVRGQASVDAETGENHFTPLPNGKHIYVIKSRENSYYSNMINKIITK